MENDKAVIKNKYRSSDMHVRVKDKRRKWIETFSTILLSAATILSAWCVYEASQWNGEQYFRIEDENMADRARMENEIASQQRMAADAAIFLQFVNAHSGGNEKFADFLIERFPEHLQRATAAWKELDPLNNPKAPVSPMHMKEYVLPEKADIAKYTEQAKEFKRQADECDHNSDNYMLLSLVLSMVLFFCGLSGVTDAISNKLILVGFATIIFLITVYFLIKFPIIF